MTMAIALGNRTKLTTESERLLIELGGQDPDRSLDRTELASALREAIEILAERRSPLLEKLYRQISESDRTSDQD
jgi:hypothetical protein